MTFRTLALGTAAGIALLCSGSAFALDNASSVQGVVKGANGQPVAGAFVRLKNADKRLTFMVISQNGGAYTASDLPPGNYTVQGVGGNMQSAISAAVAVPANGIGKMDVTLNQEIAARRLRRLGRIVFPEAQLANLPKEASALPENPGKQLVAEKCTTCHDVQRIMAKRSPAEDWAFTIKRMRTNLVNAKMPDLSDADSDAILKYVTASFQAPGGGDPNSRLPTYLMTGLSTKYRVVTIDLPRRYSEPHDIASDPKGIAWAAERAGALIRFDPTNYDFTEVRVPPGPAPADRQRLGNPQINAQGVLWTADGPNNRWLSYDTNAFNRENPGVAFHIYPWTATGHGGAGGNSFALHPDGTIWGTGQGREVRVLNPATAEFSFYEAPSYSQTKEAPGAYGLAVAGDGSVWWAEDDADMMARVDPKTGKVEEFKLPDVGGHALPRRMNSDWNGDLWVGLWNVGKLMKIDHKTKEMKVYTPKTDGLGMYTVTVDKKNKYIWVSAQQVDKMFRFDPAKEEFVEFPMAYSQQDARRVELNTVNPNMVFFSGNTADRIGFVELLP